jgi:peptidoglycan/LPS O-acetylase OafA/YrhL
VAAAFLVLAELQRTIALPLGFKLPESVFWLFSKQTWGPLRAVYCVVLLMLGYLALRELMPRISFRPALIAVRFLERQGHRSFVAFLLHLVPALLASYFMVWTMPRWIQEFTAIASVAVLYALASNNRVVALLRNRA